MTALKKELDARVIDLDTRHVVLTPDKYTLAIERLLFSGGGAMDIEVLTLSRLQQRIAPLKALSREGGVMMVRRATENIGDSLRYFAQCDRFSGFADRMYGTIGQLRAARITADALEKKESDDGKFKDVAMIFREYERISRDKNVDSAGRLCALIDASENDAFIKSCKFYAVNYTETTALTAAALDALSRSSRGMKYYTVSGEMKRSSAELSVYEGMSYADEVKTCALDIANYIKKGNAADVAVICNDARPIKRVFDEYDIPFCADIKRPLSDFAICRYIWLLSELKTYLSKAKMTELAKNPYSGIAYDDSAEFELYIDRRAVDYKGFENPFDEERAENVRKKLIKSISSFKGFSDAVRNIGECRSEDEVAKNKLLAIVKDAEAIGYGSRGDIILEAIKSCSVAILPAVSDSVTVGDAESLRGLSFKRLYIVGANDGVLPAPKQDDALVTDYELDGQATPTVRQINNRRALDIIHCALACEKVCVSYTVSNSSRKSFIVDRLCGLFSGVRKRTYYDKTEAMKNGANIEYCLATKSAMQEYGALYPLTKAAGAIHKALSERGLYHIVSQEKSDLESIDGSDFFTSSQASVTQLTRFFVCPRQHFLSYGMRLKEREIGGVSALEFGSIMHAVMQKFVADEKMDASESAITKLVENALTTYNGLYNVPERVKKRIVDDAVPFAARVKAQIEGGSFKVCWVEKRFGMSENNGDILKIHSSPDVYLTGVIDRADESDGYLRIVDYKTGSKVFSAKPLYCGLELQLPVYALFALSQGRQAHAFYYMPLSKFGEEKRISGMMLNDIDLAERMDSAYSTSGESELFPIKLTAKGDLNKGFAKDNEVFSNIVNYARELSKSAAENIVKGYRRPSPIDEDRCGFCAYKSVCCYREQEREAGKVTDDSFAV